MTGGHLLSVERVGLRAETAGSGARVMEVAAEGGGQERLEDNLGAPKPPSVPGEDMGIAASNLLEDGQRQPQQEDKLESVVEGEPVDDADKALQDTVTQVSFCGIGTESQMGLT